MTSLIVKEDGLIYVNEVPPHYLSGEGIKKYSESFNYSDPRLAYEADIASATESAILCADQEQAKDLIWQFHKAFYKVPPGIYPIHDLRWGVKWMNKKGGVSDKPEAYKVAVISIP